MARRSPRVLPLVAAALLVAACGGDDDDDSDSTAATGSAAAPPSSVASGTTAASGSPAATAGTSDDVSETTAGSTVASTAPDEEERVLPVSCEFRDDEIIATSGRTADIEDTLGATVESETSLSGEGALDEFEIGLSVYTGVGDPIQASIDLLAEDLADFEVSPNYLYTFSPGWRYAPAGAPTSVGARGEPVAWLYNDDVSIAVVDTGFTPVDTGSTSVDATLAETLNTFREPPSINEREFRREPTSTVPPWHPPAPVADLTTGPAAGHGTFIVYLLAQLLPFAEFTVATIPGDRPDDGAHAMAAGPTVPVRDDAQVTRTLSASLDPDLEYLNLSFGTYGCSGATFDVGADASFLTPLGLRTVLDALAEAGTPTKVFAAAGNDEVRPEHELSFYPAAWAPEHSWLTSVASDPLLDGTDYSNRDRWVEVQARGSDSISVLPAIGSTRAEGWYSWSGTSFATPCALAMQVAIDHQVVDPAERVPEMDPTVPQTPDDVTAGRFIDCGVNPP